MQVFSLSLQYIHIFVLKYCCKFPQKCALLYQNDTDGVLPQEGCSEKFFFTERKSAMFFKKLLLVLLSVLLCLVLVWGTVGAVNLLVYRDYFSGREKVCAIPDVHKGYTPQGIGYDEATKTYLFSGYDGKHLTMYLSDGTNARKLFPLNKDGSTAKGHGGGITASGDYVYVTGENLLLVYRMRDLTNAKNGDSVRAVEEVKVDYATSYCFADETHLYVGEFYRAGNYETAQSHYYRTPAGDEHRAIVVCYDLNENGSLASEVPAFAISVTGLVQGFAVKNDTYLLSRSWGLATAYLEMYAGLKKSDITVPVGENEIPLYYLDSSNLKQTVDLPPFSEDLDICGDKVLINFESACNKYIAGKFYFADDVVSYPIPDYRTK